MHINPWFVTAGALTLLSTGCTSAPRQSVELIEIVGEQIAEMQRSHEQFVHLYYDKLRADVDTFMAEKWIPQFLSNVVDGAGESSRDFRRKLDISYELAGLDWNAAVNVDNIANESAREAVSEALHKLATEERSELGMVLLDFSNAVQVQVNKRRKTLLDPINEQENQVLDHLRETYADLQRGTATTKAYLQSVVDVVAQRDGVLQQLGVLDEQRELLNGAVSISEKAGAALSLAEDPDSGVEDFLSILKAED